MSLRTIVLSIALFAAAAVAAPQTESFGGIGITIQGTPQGILVVGVVPNSPAFGAGLQSGDLVLQANGQDLRSLSLDAARDLLRGETGTALSLQVQQTGASEPTSVSMQRVAIEVQAIQSAQVAQFYGDAQESATIRSTDLLYYVRNQIKEGYQLGGVMIDGRALGQSEEVSARAQMSAISLGEAVQRPMAPTVQPLFQLTAYDRQNLHIDFRTAGSVDLRVLDRQGRTVFSSREQAAVGTLTAAWNGATLPSGQYTLRTTQAGVTAHWALPLQ